MIAPKDGSEKKAAPGTGSAGSQRARSSKAKFRVTTKVDENIYCKNPMRLGRYMLNEDRKARIPLSLDDARRQAAIDIENISHNLKAGFRMKLMAGYFAEVSERISEWCALDERRRGAA